MRLSLDRLLTLVIVRDLDFVGISLLPPETDPVLIVDPNAVLSAPTPLQPLKSIARGCSQLPKGTNAVQLIELT